MEGSDGSFSFMCVSVAVTLYAGGRSLSGGNASVAWAGRGDGGGEYAGGLRRPCAGRQEGPVETWQKGPKLIRSKFDSSDRGETYSRLQNGCCPIWSILQHTQTNLPSMMRTAIHLQHMTRLQQSSRRYCMTGFSVLSSYCGARSDIMTAQVQHASPSMIADQNYSPTQITRAMVVCEDQINQMGSDKLK